MFFSSRIHRTAPRRFGALVLSGALVASFAGFALANPASAAHVEGVPYAGNLSCAEAEDVPEGGEATWLELKVEAADMKDNPADIDGESTHTGPNGLEITIENATLQTFDWTSSLDLVAVLVKGGTGGGGLQYSYPAAADGLSDTGLHAPSLVGEGTDLYYDISHVSFCFVVVKTPDVPVIEDTTPVVVQPAVEPAPEVVAAIPTTVLGETLVAGDTLPRTGAAATNTLALAGGLGLAFGLMMLMLGRRKTAIHSS